MVLVEARDQLLAERRVHGHDTCLRLELRLGRLRRRRGDAGLARHGVARVAKGQPTLIVAAVGFLARAIVGAPGGTSSCFEEFVWRMVR
jgi:hypothetical protein